ncbi:MAG: site-specific integrase [Rhizobiales bacterium]|nr:site-specific integrase [Hyphomicrobiales bacterium]MBO6697852.1 site-specific integrase [Hyphomicrobiales bacterium]MBO6735893.1 site-specific integrase [Hyphomicrobiales bacterium]MBO6913905.1 site-specific integrase [Hyphomicrobiales bacterium]MBO6955608.1 site-specific integrase [Hyphomicrobiales bacterium]
MDKHTILDGKVHLYRRNTGPTWQCSAYLGGKNQRVSTKETSLARAKDFAEDWFFTLRDMQRRGENLGEPTFKLAADRFQAEYEALTDGDRNARWVNDHYRRLRLHLVPFFGSYGLSKVTSGLIQEYRLKRLKPPVEGAEANEDGEDAKPWKPPSRSTLHHEMVTLRLVLKTAIRHGWLTHLPDMSTPYRSAGKVVHRGWFSPEEYKRLYESTRANIQQMKNAKHRYLAEQLHDKVLFMANTGLRPDEINVLEYRDVEIVEDEDSGETILVIQVRGKRGVGYCKSTAGAVFPFQRLVKRNQPQPTDRVFPHDHKKAFNRILHDLELKTDRQGNQRTFYSLRHSYISFRLLEGADIYQIAKNCRTSVEMIEQHYAVHLKNAIDARAVNRRQSKSGKGNEARWLELNTHLT